MFRYREPKVHQLVVGGRLYRPVPYFFLNDPRPITITEMRGRIETKISRGEETRERVYLVEEDGTHFLDHSGDISLDLRGNAVFCFLGWKNPEPRLSGYFACVLFNGDWFRPPDRGRWVLRGGKWIQSWSWILGGCDALHCNDSVLIMGRG